MARAARKTLSDLLAVMAALRAPGSGCPWDLEQTFESIAPFTIEEAYEVAEAIARGDRNELLEELGDLLLQVVYHARMAEEEGAFAFADVVDQITRKMLRRHPHVFGTAAERAAGAPDGFWERIKDAEKRGRASARASARGSARRSAKGADERSHAPAAVGRAPRSEGRASILADVPIALPALTRAVKLQNKAAQVGFDWPDLAPVLAKLHEELAELQSAIAAAGRGKQNRAEAAAIAEELGDVLFVLSNVARHLKIDPEASLRAANAKFMRRFRRIEEWLAAAGRDPAEATLAEMDQVWEEAKAEERATPSLAPVGWDAESARKKVPKTSQKQDAKEGQKTGVKSGLKTGLKTGKKQNLKPNRREEKKRDNHHPKGRSTM
jgi:ATP diphosphatase